MRFLPCGAVLLALGCSTPAEECFQIDSECIPQYEPTFDNIHARTVAGSCAISGTSCHATDDSSSGFSLADVDGAYDELSRRARGVECSVLLKRLTSDVAGFQMPPGMPLSDGELCAISLWVEAGAPR